MKRAAFALIVTALSVGGLIGQDDKMIERRDKKLESEFLKKAAWITDYAKAKEASKKEGKPIFAYFTRSYAN
jgi:hypothetical protein